MSHYIYAHIKLTTGEVFYIGKGVHNRIISKQNRSKYWHNTVNKYGYDAILIETDLSESQANTQEKYWINRIGRKDQNKGSLVNFTDGGEGSCGRTVSLKTREAVAKANKSRIISDAQRNVKNLWKNKTGALHNRSKKIICIESQIEYGSMSEASRMLNIGCSSISWSVKNNRPILGMHFQIKE